VKEEIIEKADRILNIKQDFDKGLYGNGKSGELILEKLKNY
jgi:hypothetical protein